MSETVDDVVQAIRTHLDMTISSGVPLMADASERRDRTHFLSLSQRELRLLVDALATARAALEDVRRSLRVMNELHNLGDAVYEVREREGKGWAGPNVTHYAAAHKDVMDFLDGRALAQEAGDDAR